MKTIYVSLFFFINLMVLFFGGYLFSQERCNSPKESADLGVITKCAIKSWKENDNDKAVSSKYKRSKQVTLIVSKLRTLKKRKRETVGTVNKILHKDDIASVESNISTDNLKIENTAKQEIAFPFESVERIPAFPRCKTVEKSNSLACFNKQIAEHIKKNFNYPAGALKEGVEGRVYVQFVIDKYGGVSEIRCRGPKYGVLLEDEARRIIEKLPKFSPAIDNGVAVNSKYFMPIIFKLPEGYKKRKDKIENVISFAQVAKIPQFSGCPKNKSDTEGLDCFNDQMIRHIQANFTYPEEAYKNNIEGKVWIYFVINKKGEVVDITATTPNNQRVLEREAKRVISKLAVFTPGIEKGIPVNVRYGMPIHFELQ